MVTDVAGPGAPISNKAQADDVLRTWLGERRLKFIW